MNLYNKKKCKLFVSKHKWSYAVERKNNVLYVLIDHLLVIPEKQKGKLKIDCWDYNKNKKTQDNVVKVA